MSIQASCSLVKPFFSLRAAYAYFKNITPVKKFIKKKLPINMKPIKNIPLIFSISTIGPKSTADASIALSNTSGQASVDASQNKVSSEVPILSKFSYQGYQVPPAFSQEWRVSSTYLYSPSILQ